MDANSPEGTDAAETPGTRRIDAELGLPRDAPPRATSPAGYGMLVAVLILVVHLLAHDPAAVAEDHFLLLRDRLLGRYEDEGDAERRHRVLSFARAYMHAAAALHRPEVAASAVPV